MRNNLHETIISASFQEIPVVYIYSRTQVNCTMEKKNHNRIKAVLAEKNISSKDLAKQLNKTESTVSRWCTNDVQPSIPVLSQIADILDVDVRELLVSTK